MNRLSNWSSSDSRGLIGLAIMMIAFVLSVTSIIYFWGIYQFKSTIDVISLFYLGLSILCWIVGFYFRDSLPDNESQNISKRIGE